MALDGEPQRQGWMSWLRQSIWSPCQPETVDVEDGRGKFFPFLGPSSLAARTERQPPRGAAPDARTTRVSNTSGGASVTDEERPPSTRIAGGQEKQLKREIPAIWKYLREEEGWSFANSHGWDVRGPPPTVPVPSGGVESSDYSQHRTGPMPQGQLATYLVDNPLLLRNYRRWLSKASPPPEEINGGSDDDRGSGNGAESGVPAEPEREDEGGAAASALADPSRERKNQQKRVQAQGWQQQQQQQQQPATTRSPSPGDSTVAPPDPLPPYPASPGFAGGGGSTGSAGGSSLGRDDGKRCSAVTPPLALRTRSRGRGQPGSAQPGGASEQTRDRREQGQGGGGGQGGGEEATASKALRDQGRCSFVRGWQGVDGSSGEAPGGGVSCGSADEREQQQRVPRLAKGKGRRKTLVVVAGGGVAGRVLGSGRRVGAAAKRRHSDVGGRDKAESGAGSGAALPPSAKRPKVKLERDDARGLLRPAVPGGSAAAAARPQNASPSRARSGGGGSSGSGGVGGDPDDDDDDDPLAPYARIEAETVDDEGLEELLHTKRRDGFLDLRRYRKPGWPRPLRITRLEASHGKRFEEHLLLLLKQKRRVEANVLLRRLAHYDRNPPHLAASLLGGRGHVACIPDWYQTLSAPESLSSAPAAGGVGAGGEGGEDDGIEEVVDLTEKEVEVVECFDNEPLDCVMMRIVKQEPGLEEEEGSSAAAAVGTTAYLQGSSAKGAGTTDLASTSSRVKMEVE